MIHFTENLFNDFSEMQLEVFKNEDKILSRWGQQYDPEQMLEHAIGHGMLHQLQVERFLKSMRLHFNF